MDKKLVTVATISAILGAGAGSAIDASAAVEVLLAPKRIAPVVVAADNAGIVSVTNAIRARAGLAASDTLDTACFSYTEQPGKVVIRVDSRQELAVDTAISPALKDLAGVSAKQ